MQIQTNAQVTINDSIESVFDISTDCQNLPKFFTGYKAIPAIVSAKTVDGLPLHTGSTRIVHNGDGSSVEEIIVEVRRPTIQKYQLIKGLKPPFSWLVSIAFGSWLYETIDTRTKITWEFNFEVRNIFAYWIFLLLVKNPFQRSQEICLENIKSYIEQS